MSKRCQLTEFEWKEIIGLWKESHSEQNIGNILYYPKSTIHKIIIQYKDT